MGFIGKFFEQCNNGIDAAVIIDDVNRFYFSGFDTSFGIILLTPDKAWFLTDPRYVAEATGALPSDFTVEKCNYIEAMDFIKSYCSENTVTRLGYENATILHEDFVCLNALKDVKLVGISSILGEMRSVKTPEEICFIRRAAQISDKAFNNTVKRIKGGIIERDLQIELDYQMRLLGADSTAFETIVAFGKKTAYPHAHSADKKLEKGDLILMDFGAKVGHYCSDMTRTMSFGEPDVNIKYVYASVLSAQKYALSALRAGLTGREVDSFAREYLIAKGYKNMFTHALGHGIGLDIHENPTLSPRSEVVLKENMVVTCEPGVYIEGLGGVRIEDSVLIKNDGIELLNTVSKELIIL